MTPRQRLGAFLIMLPVIVVGVGGAVVIFGLKVAALGALALAAMGVPIWVGVDLLDDKPPPRVWPRR